MFASTFRCLRDLSRSPAASAAVIVLASLFLWHNAPGKTPSRTDFSFRYQVRPADPPPDCFACAAPQLDTSGFVNYIVGTTNRDRREISIAASPDGSGVLFAGFHVYWYPPEILDPRLASLYSTDSGRTWSGDEEMSNQPDSSSWYDPTVAMVSDTKVYYLFLDNGHWLFSQSTDAGVSWSGPDTLPMGPFADKPHMAVDLTSSSPYDENIYCVTMTGQGYPVYFSRSEDVGASFDTAIVINPHPYSSFWAHSPNVAVGPNGEVYVAWGSLDSARYESTGQFVILEFDGISFRRSLDGGDSFFDTLDTDTARKILDIAGYWRPGGSLPSAVQTNPVLAGDTTSCTYGGRLYIVWSDSSYSDPSLDIRLSYSDDSGVTWQSPITLGDDDIYGERDQVMPWMTVDPYGSVSVVYYAWDDDSNVAEVRCAQSSDGGATFIDNRVGDYKFDVCGSIADYIGITSDDEFAYPCWVDVRAFNPCPNKAVVARVPFAYRDTLSGHITANDTICGRWLLTGDVTIDSGVTLSLAHNAWLVAKGFSDDQGGGEDDGLVEIIVEGTLELNSVALDMVGRSSAATPALRAPGTASESDLVESCRRAPAVRFERLWWG